jgi:enolase-phosphatase E1
VISAILTDIEGTTSSISFVKDVLFPFARKRLPAFVETHADKPEVQHWLHEAARDAGIIHAERSAGSTRTARPRRSRRCKA